MATTQEDLLKALRGNSGREQVNFDLGQVGLRPTIQRGGQYAVPLRDAPKTNSALQLADALKDTSQLLNSFVDIQSKQGEIEASVLSPQEVQQKVEQGDPNAVSFLDKLGKEKAFTENVYKRYFNSTVQPKLLTLQQELKSRPVHEYADMGITTPEDFQEYANGRVKELTDEFSQYTSKSPYAQALHNQLVETIVPDLVVKQTALFDEGVTQFNKDSALQNLMPFGENSGTPLNPPSNKPTSLREKARGTIYGFEKKGDSTWDYFSSIAVGANASEKEIAEIKAGKTNDAKLVPNKDFALSPDLEEQFKAQGFKLRDTVTLTLDDGTTHTGRWMDRTAKEFQGKPLSGRVDIYSPDGDSPLKDKTFAGFARSGEEPMKKFANDVSTVAQLNDNILAAAKFSPIERSKILRDNAITQIKTLSSNSNFAEAKKLLASLSDAKVNNQPLFGSAEGQLQLASLEDLIDRDEEQEYAQNERTSKKKVEQEIAGVSLRLLNATPDNLEDEYGAVRSDINDRQGLTDAEKVLAIKELDQLYQNRAAAEYTKATRSDAALNKLNAEGGSADAFTNFRNLPASDDRIAGFVAGSKTLQKQALISDPLTGKQAINPAFTQQMRASIVTVGAQKNLLNEEQTEKIRRGESFTYDFNGKSIEFEGTTDPKQQKQLHIRLGQAFQEDLNSSLIKQLESDIAVNPQFSTSQAGKATSLYDQKVNELTTKGYPVEQAQKLVSQELQKGTEDVIRNGKARTNRGIFESPKEYVKAVSNAFATGLVPPEEAEALHRAAVFNNREVVKENAAKVASNPLANMGVLDELDKSFTDIGIPWEATKNGHITYYSNVPIVSPDGVSYDRREEYFSIKQFLSREGSETKYRILPIDVLRSKENPEARKVIEKIAEKYGKTYDSLVAGQEAWYESRNIKISK